MSWQLVSFLILAGVLLAGFAWYERSRPPAQVVALVAALAALAIAGRIAFAAFPNVKPTTDIVIFAGFALGGAPGFAVGALTALVSNFWFGQGPWTPWQMAAWGICGLIGAALGLGWRNVGRFGLAAVCGGAALIYGALLNFSLMATYGGDLSWQRFALYEGRAVPFEIAHVAGNVAFALVAGPALLRMLVRFRERFEWTRSEGDGRAPGGDPAGGDSSGRGRRLSPKLRGGVAALLLLVLAAALGAPAPAHAARAEIGPATKWLVAAQNDDGGFGPSPGKDSGAETTCWAMLGLEAAGINPADLRRSGKSPVDFLRRSVAKLKRPGDVARTILALQGAGLDPRHFGGHNLVARLLAKRRKDGSFEGWPTSTAFAVIALRGAGVTGSLKKTLEWLHEAQGEDGGWGDLPGSPSTPDTTGAVLQALTPGSKASKRGLAYLGEVQRKGGGFPLGGNGEVNSQSTAWAIQGILATGGKPASYRRGGASALDYLGARQAKDGHVRYSKSSDQTPTWVTGEALVAVTGKYFPLTPPPRVAKTSPTKTNPTSPSQTAPPATTQTPSSPVPTSPEQVAPATSGGASTPTPFPLPGNESPSGSGGGSAGGGGGSSSGQSTPPNQIPLEEIPNGEPSGGASGGAPTTPAPEEASASGQEASSGSGASTDVSPLGSILAGLAAGGLLFGGALGARKGWMHWRYGL